MQQLAIPLARRSDPETSYRAADRATQFKAKHESTIFNAIFEAGPRGATAKEIAAVTGLTDVQVNRRLGNMGRRGVIERNANTDCSEYEQRGGCCVWRVA